MHINAVTEFIDNVINAVRNAIREGDYPTWDDFCVDMTLPADILAGHKLTVWGEVNDEGERYFSVYVKTCDEDIRFSLICDNTSMEALGNTLAEAMECAAAS